MIRSCGSSDNIVDSIAVYEPKVPVGSISEVLWIVAKIYCSFKRHLLMYVPASLYFCGILHGLCLLLLGLNETTFGIIF